MSYKRGVLSSIFERKISFNSCSEWQIDKLGNIFAERIERASGNEELLSVTINDGIQKRADFEAKDNSSENKTNYKKVFTGDIAYNTMRMWQGASGDSPYDGIVSPAYTVIFPLETHSHSTRFWAYYFKHTPLVRTFQKFSQGLTSDTWNLKYPQFSQITVAFPNIDEQQKIADFLDSLAYKITVEESNLNYLTQHKRQLLQDMFI